MSMYDPATSLRQMLDYAREAVDLAKGKTREDLATNRLLNLALTRLIEIVGEASNRITGNDQSRHPNIPWRKMIGMRNRLIHGYDQIELDALWETVERDLPALIAALERIIPAAHDGIIE